MTADLDDMSTDTDECAEGGRHWSQTRRNDDGSTYEMCTECGDLLSDDGS